MLAPVEGREVGREVAAQGRGGAGQDEAVAGQGDEPVLGRDRGPGGDERDPWRVVLEADAAAGGGQDRRAEQRADDPPAVDTPTSLRHVTHRRTGFEPCSAVA